MFHFDVISYPYKKRQVPSLLEYQRKCNVQKPVRRYQNDILIDDETFPMVNETKNANRKKMHKKEASITGSLSFIIEKS